MIAVDNNVQETLHGYIAEQFLGGNGGNLKADTQLLANGILDSISALQVVDFVEEKFGVEFAAHEVDQDNLSSINAISSFIQSKQAA